MMWLLFLLVFGFAGIKHHVCVQTNDANILVLLDNPLTLETHADFLKSLEKRGFILTVKMADYSGLKIQEYGKYLYKNLIIFAPNVEQFGGQLSVKKLTQFVDDGGNVIVTGDQTAGYAVREFIAACGVELDDEEAMVIDHLNYDTLTDNGNCTSILTRRHLSKAPLIVGDTNATLLYRGAALLRPKPHKAILNILTAESTAYSASISQKTNFQYPHAFGRQMTLIAGLQAKNNARVLMIGSLDFFSSATFDALVKYPGDIGRQSTGNAAFAQSLTDWVFGKRGLLRITAVNHHKVNELQPPTDAYSINDAITYTIDLEELIYNKWVPFTKADGIQLEFVRIDPFIRKTLVQKAPGHYVVSFRIPDVQGVYKLRILYDRLGYTRLYNCTQVAVRPLKTDQYDRFIPVAYPYYVSAFSMMIGVFIFSFVFLHYQDKQPTSNKKKS